MHATGLLAQWLAQHSVIGHRAREAALLKLVHAVLGGSNLSLTQLGRYRPGTAYTKHHIKAADITEGAHVALGRTEQAPRQVVGSPRPRGILVGERPVHQGPQIAIPPEICVRLRQRRHRAVTGFPTEATGE